MSSDLDQLQELVAFVARSLVDDPDAVEVHVVDGDRAVVFELSVAPDDLGKVIGKDGRTARAIRTLLAATSAKLRKRAVLEILE
ncbi:MAG: KH domain-containing protein [Polyangiales bacterium]